MCVCVCMHVDNLALWFAGLQTDNTHTQGTSPSPGTAALDDKSMDLEPEATMWEVRGSEAGTGK